LPAEQTGKARSEQAVRNRRKDLLAGRATAAAGTGRAAQDAAAQDAAVPDTAAGSAALDTAPVGSAPPAATRPGRQTRVGGQALGRWLKQSELRLYLAAAGLTGVAVAVMMRLWNADWSAPFYYSSDALGSAAHFKTTLETGWYEYQPRLGVPYGQRYHDYPFSDDLHPAMAKLLGVLTGNWITAFNTYYLLTFVLCAVTAVWFFRVCGLSGAMAVVLAVLFAVAPYHFVRNETHLFLSGYYLVPPGLVLVLRTARGERLWGRRPGRGRLRSLVTGRGVGTVLILGLLIWDGVYYAIFTGSLLVAAALLAMARYRDRRRLGGAVSAAVVLAGFYALALLPDLLYSLRHGSDGDAFVRIPNDAQLYGLRFAQLVMPPPGHPFTPFAAFRAWFDDRYPPVAEYPALGLVATIGFLLLLAAGLTAMVNGRHWAVAPDGSSRRDTIRLLAALTWVAFLLATTGGLGLFASMAITGIRGWNRMSIVIGLLALAGLGLAVEAVLARAARRFARRAGTRSRPGRWSPAALRGQRAIPAVTVALVLVVGVGDQSLDSAVPDPAEAASFHSDQVFFGALQQALPTGSSVFQLPYRPFPESRLINETTDSDQLRPFLNTTTLRWSAGGIKGRPQTDWPERVGNESTANMTHDLAVAGFTGILIDRHATDDGGGSLEADLEPYTGAVRSTSPDGRWSYLSLDKIAAQIRLTMPAAQRARQAAAITGNLG
jgi:hypothetical protein